ncbi:Xaa-Pro peptidase family protein [Corynebacterium sp. 35RC1]|nr:Xaa-Pro peptidase family protein [Corynebacterium sp. 35RC1]
MSAAHNPSLFPAQVYAGRLTAAQEHLQRAGLHGVVIGAGPHLAYFTGSWLSTFERLTALIIPANGAPTMIVPAVDAGDLALSAVPELEVTVRSWTDGEPAHEYAVAALLGSSGGVTNPALAQPVNVGISPDLSAAHLLKIQELLGPGSRTVLGTEVLAALFVAKDEAEIAQLRLAAQAIDRVHAAVPALLQAGVTEASVAAQIRELILQEHVAVDFTIVGSGPHGANPHHEFSSRVLETGDVVVVDIGGTTAYGYHSDCTRTYVVGDPQQVEPEIREMYEVLYRAQAAQLEAIRPGVTAEHIDAIGREIITQAGFGEYFIHRTGHGIGLSTHEEPNIMAGNTLVLEEGMAFSVEPGIYLPGVAGARIEDIVVVTAQGVEVLNTQPRELQGSKP